MTYCGRIVLVPATLWDVWRGAHRGEMLPALGGQVSSSCLVLLWSHCCVITTAGDDGNRELGGSSAPTFWEVVVSWKR